MQTFPMFVTRGPMAGQLVPATDEMMAAARAGGYGMRPGVDGVPPRPDRGAHEAGDRFAAAYADRQLRAAMYERPDPMAAAKAALEPVEAAPASGNETGQVPDGPKRKRGRPPGAKGGEHG